MSERGRLIAFEGVDGAGKSTVIRRVAEHLQAQGHTVFMPRTGKEHNSRPTRMIRRLTRDQRNLDLSARAELLLYSAREAQVLEELVRPALSRGETVLIDRSLLTPEVLGRARGLGAEECRHAAAVAAHGLEPDMTLVFSVHPRTSRIRKRIERVTDHGLAQEGGRKGLAGSAFKERVRDLYVAIAQERGYPLFHVERVTPGQLAERVIQVVSHGASAEAVQTPEDQEPQWIVDPALPFPQALDQLPVPVALFLSQGLLAGRDLRASARSTHATLAAWAMDAEDPLREGFAADEPEYALRGQKRRPVDGSDDLRLRLLERVPDAALAALRYARGGDFDGLRERHAASHPDGVLSSLAGHDDEFAVALRARCWKAGSDAARAASISGCVGVEAWKRRESLFEKHPVNALGTLSGIQDPRADRWLEELADRAPKKVLSALGGRGDDFAYAMRDALFETGREVVASVKHLSDERAFALRERGLARWPSTVAQSLIGLPMEGQAASLLSRCRELAGGDVHVLRRLQACEEWPLRPAWAVSAATDSGEDE